MNNVFRPAMVALTSALTALALVACLLAGTDQSISPRQVNQYQVAESYVGMRPMGKMDPSRVISVLKSGFNATIAILSPLGRVMCSGTTIMHEPDKHLIILTAWHCVRGAYPAVIPVALLYSGEVVPMIVQKKKEDWDLATLISLYPVRKAGPVAKMAAQDPQLGETIWIIGHPRGILGNITRGVLSNYLHVSNDLRYYRIDAQLFYGNSGGGMYNSHGELVGVADAVEFSRNPDGSSQLVPGGGLCVSLYNVKQLVGNL